MTSHSVTLTGLDPDTVYHFGVSSTDGSGNTAVEPDATFTTSSVAGPDVTAPVVSGVGVSVAESSAVVSWVTDEPADSVVSFGETAGYELGSESSSGLVTSHSVTLTGLDPDTVYHFGVSSTDGSGNVAVEPDATFTTNPLPAGGSGFVSDDFSGGVLGSEWRVIDPVGDGSVAVTGVGTSDAHLELTVGGGQSHDVWRNRNDVLQVVQDVSDDDFLIEAKFESVPAGWMVLQGILISDDSDSWTRFEMHSQGSDVNLFVARNRNGTSRVLLSEQVDPSLTSHFRIGRSGDDWTLWTSGDGVSWTERVTFSFVLDVKTMGPFVGNAGSAPQFTAVVDYVFDAGSPVVPEDPSGPDVTAPVVSGVGVSVTESSAVVSWVTDEPADSVVSFGETAGYELGSESSSGLVTSHSVTLTGLDPDTVYHFGVSSTDGSGNTAVEPDATFTTSSVAGGGGPLTFQKVQIGTGVEETHIAVGADFDGDGDIDVAATDFPNDRVVWFENTPTGFVERVLDGALDGAYPANVGDVDNDGDPDVLAGGYNSDELVWYDNDGSANFTRVVVDSAADGIHSVVVVDLDEDGDEDLVTSNQDGGSIDWFENDGSENWTRHTVDAAAVGAKRAEVADVDGDGDLDVLAASFGDDTVAWHENDGSENFTKHVVDAAADGAYYVHSADFDGDGDIDLLSAGKSDDTIAWYENDGSESFTKRVIESAAGGARTAIAVDLDDDGDMDVASASVDDDTIAWFENDGSGNFTTRLVDGTTNGPYGLVDIDFDGDGDTDLLGAGNKDHVISVHLQQ